MLKLQQVEMATLEAVLAAVGARMAKTAACVAAGDADKEGMTLDQEKILIFLYSIYVADQGISPQYQSSDAVAVAIKPQVLKRDWARRQLARLVEVGLAQTCDGEFYISKYGVFLMQRRFDPKGWSDRVTVGTIISSVQREMSQLVQEVVDAAQKRANEVDDD